jgi:hypothetical protein
MTKIENDTSQSERREILRNDRLARSTYLDHAIARAEDEAGGRFAKQAPTTVTGGPQYPRQPAGSPWSQGHVVGPEAPLGFSVDAIEPVGTPAEVQRSIERNEVGDAAALPHAVSAPGPASAEVSLGLGGAGPTAERKAKLAQHRQRDFQLETVRRA